MPRNDGTNYTVARNRDLVGSDVGKAQAHNEREKDYYSNLDIVTGESIRNIHFKQPTGSYEEMFEKLKIDKIISTRGLKADAVTYCEMIFDVNTTYFHERGGYEYAKQFYTDAYKVAIEIVGGEQYILSAVMHADERNRAVSEAVGHDVFHYHLHVVYVPVVEKQILWTKRCKDKSLVGTVKETIMQVSRSKKWESQPALDENGNPLVSEKGKQVYVPSYRVLQDHFYQAMKKAGYEDIERGTVGSTEEHLTVTQFKVQAEQERLRQLEADIDFIAFETEMFEYRQKEAEERLDRAEMRLEELSPTLEKMEDLAAQFSDDPEQTLPLPGPFESAKSYREKKVKPIYRKIVEVLRSLYLKYLNLCRQYDDLHRMYERERSRNYQKSQRIEELTNENHKLKGIAADFDRARKALGKDVVESAVETVKQEELLTRKSKRKHQHFR